MAQGVMAVLTMILCCQWASFDSKPTIRRIFGQGQKRERGSRELAESFTKRKLQRGKEVDALLLVTDLHLLVQRRRQRWPQQKVGSIMTDLHQLLRWLIDILYVASATRIDLYVASATEDWS